VQKAPWLSDLATILGCCLGTIGTRDRLDEASRSSCPRVLYVHRQQLAGSARKIRNLWENPHTLRVYVRT